jgi:hypothetical protein
MRALGCKSDMDNFLDFSHSSNAHHQSVISKTAGMTGSYHSLAYLANSLTLPAFALFVQAL